MASSSSKTPFPAVGISTRIESPLWGDGRRIRALARRVIAAALRHDVPVLPQSEVSLLFTDDAAMHVLNRAWRGMDKATNVLSFPGSKPNRAGAYGPALGDIVLACETVRREAEEQHLTFDHHLSHLIVHGFLHLFGHDHHEDGEAERMESLETAILGSLGIEDPYASPEVRAADGER